MSLVLSLSLYIAPLLLVVSLRCSAHTPPHPLTHIDAHADTQNYQANIERADSFNTRSTSGTVEDVMERLEFGSFQVGLTFACGLTFMSDAVQINLM